MSLNSILNTVLLGLIVFMGASTLAQDPDYRYAVIDLGDLGGNASNAFALNEAGEVVGAAWFPGNVVFHAVAYFNTGMVDFGTFGGRNSNAYDINTSAQVVGFAWTRDDLPHAFLYQDKNMIDLGTLGGNTSTALGINELGQIVGKANITSGHLHACIWDSGLAQDLGAFGGESGSSAAWDINERGQIVGYSTKEARVDGDTAVLWNDGDMTDLGGLSGYRRSGAYAINDLGDIAGYSENSRGHDRAVVWTGENIYNLQPTNQNIDYSFAKGINNLHQIVGGYQEFGSNLDRAFLWDQVHGWQNIDNFVPPRLSMTMAADQDINDNGEIAAWGEMKKSHWFRALLLVPVDPELTLSDPVPGLAGQVNTWTITNAQPGSKIIFTYSLQGGGTVVPGCDKLDAVLQLNNPKIMKSAIADANGEAQIEMFVPAAARNLGDILFQAVSVKDCQESQLNVFRFQ